MSTMIKVRRLVKTFHMHHQGGARLAVLKAVDFDAAAGECLVVAGPSGSGKSTLLRCLYGNYLATQGSIRIHAPELMPPTRNAATADDRSEAWVEMVNAPEQHILRTRKHVIGYVSQFLRVIPRVSALDVVAEPLLQQGAAREEARARASVLLHRLNLPGRLWSLPPATFSGGEQQRVNIARGLVANHRVLLLDEPTASLDADNRAVVIALMQEACAEGRCLIGIFHDDAVRNALATRILPLQPPARDPLPALSVTAHAPARPPFLAMGFPVQDASR